MLVAHEVAQLGEHRLALGQCGELLVDRGHGGGTVTPVTFVIPVAQQQQHVDAVRVGTRPGAGLLEVRHHRVVRVRAGVTDEGGVADLIVEEEVRRGGQVHRHAVTLLVRVHGEVKRRLLGGREGVLGIELHEAVAQLVLGHEELRRTVHPEIVVARRGREHLALALGRETGEPGLREVTLLVVEVVTEDLPVRHVVAGVDGVQ